MVTFWERLQTAAMAAYNAWQGLAKPENLPMQPGFSTSMDMVDSDRVDRYRLLWRYYRGEHRKHLKVRMTPTGPGPDDNVVINLSRRVVNQGVNFLFGKPLTWQLSENGQTPEEELLERIWGSPEKRMTFLAELALNGGVTGDFYLQIVPPLPGEELPRVVNLNPSIVFPKTDPNDISKEWAFELRWFRGDVLCRTIHALREDGQTWETWDEKMGRGQWERISEPTLWPFAWPMIIHGKNLPNPNNYYGCSDLEDADINDAINMTASNIQRITRIFAHPVVWSRGFGTNGKALDLSMVQMSDDSNATMGALELGANLASSQEYLSFLRTSFAEVTGVPQSDPDRLAIGAQSGFALKVLLNDLILKTGVKRSLYGAAIVEANRRLLDLMGMGENNVVNLHWVDPLPADLRESVENDRFELDGQIASRETISTKRGYDWAIEQKRIDSDDTGSKPVGVGFALTPAIASNTEDTDL